MNLLHDMTHRPWPLPSKKWILRQTWHNLLFLHWPLPPEVLRPYIPSSLQIDTFHRSAWLGVVVFMMDGIYARGLSPLSLTPKFPEINVRTYVQCNGKPGVYFMSLDVGNWASYTIAKKWFRLPYHRAHISFRKEEQDFYCESIRQEKTENAIRFNGTYKPSSPVYFPQKETLDHWLTERYCLYSSHNGTDIYCGEIHHRPWPLQKAAADIQLNTLFSPFQLDLGHTKPIAHFSEGVDALIWNIEKMDFRV